MCAGVPSAYFPPMVFAIALAFAALIAFVSAVFPALKLKRMDVAAILAGH